MASASPPVLGDYRYIRQRSFLNTSVRASTGLETLSAEWRALHWAHSGRTIAVRCHVHHHRSILHHLNVSNINMFHHLGSLSTSARLAGKGPPHSCAGRRGGGAAGVRAGDAGACEHKPRGVQRRHSRLQGGRAPPGRASGHADLPRHAAVRLLPPPPPPPRSCPPPSPTLLASLNSALGLGPPAHSFPIITIFELVSAQGLHTADY